MTEEEREALLDVISKLQESSKILKEWGWGWTAEAIQEHADELKMWADTDEPDEI